MPVLDTARKGPTLAQVVRRVHDIATLPHVALRVMEIANDPNSGATDLKAAMENDPALSARVLKCVNSSAYGIRGQMTNLQHAIAYLGVRQVRNLAMTAAVAKLFVGEAQIGSYQRTALWRHLVAVGIGARLIALRLSFADFEDIFLAGLLHDLGIIVEDQHVPQGFAQVMQALDDGKTLAEVERTYLGFDHTSLGDALAQNWKFPEPVRAAVRYHHVTANCPEEHLHVVRCVELANLLCTAKGISSVGRKLVTFSRQTLEALSFGSDDLVVLSEGLDQELADNANLFEI